MKVITPNPAGKTMENEIIPAINYPNTIQTFLSSKEDVLH